MADLIKLEDCAPVFVVSITKESGPVCLDINTQASNVAVPDVAGTGGIRLLVDRLESALRVEIKRLKIDGVSQEEVTAAQRRLKAVAVYARHIAKAARRPDNRSIATRAVP